MKNFFEHGPFGRGVFELKASDGQGLSGPDHEAFGLAEIERKGLAGFEGVSHDEYKRRLEAIHGISSQHPSMSGAFLNGVRPIRVLGGP